MSSLDLISRRRVRLYQLLLERITKKSGAVGIAGGSSVGGTLSFGVHPKMSLLGARQICTCDPNSSCPPGPWGSQAEWHALSLSRGQCHGATEPHVDTTSSMSIIKTCHCSFPLWEIHCVGWWWPGSCALMPAAHHLPNKTSRGAAQKKLRKILPWGRRDLIEARRHKAKIKSSLSDEILLPQISPKWQMEKTRRPICTSLVRLVCVICNSVLSSFAKA